MTKRNEKPLFGLALSVLGFTVNSALAIDQWISGDWYVLEIFVLMFGATLGLMGMIGFSYDVAERWNNKLPGLPGNCQQPISKEIGT